MTWQMHTYGAAEIIRPAWPAWIDGPYAFRSDPHARLRFDRLYLVRPDGFVAASVPLRNHDADEAQLRLVITAHRLIT